MRPVERGAQPTDLVITDYTDATEDLRLRLGAFCSYCEKPLSDITDVEHVKPKSLFQGDKLSWDNFLLACSSCNKNKGANPKDDVANYIFPDRDNPLLFLAYEPQKVPMPQPGLTGSALNRIEKTIALVGLDRDDKSLRKATRKDRRWRQRNGAWTTAMEARRLCDSNPAMMLAPEFPFWFREAVLGRGFFSVWMVAFEGLPFARQLILSFIPGTALGCFDAQGSSVARINS